MNDLGKMKKATKIYNDRLKLYYENPNMLAEDIAKVEENTINQQATNIVKGMSNIKSVKELKEQLDNIDSVYLPKVLSQLSESEDENLKKVVNNYNNLIEAQNIIRGIFREVNFTPDYQSAANIITDAFDNSDSLEESNATITKVLQDENIPESVKKTLRSVMDKYQELKKSSDTKQKDKKTPKKTN